jgi:hypothetical protein
VGHLPHSSSFRASEQLGSELEPVRRARMHEARSSPCTHRGARVIGTDALDILVISQEPSDSEERNQDNEDNPNIACNLYRRLPIAVLSSGNSNSEMSAQIIPL